MFFSLQFDVIKKYIEGGGSLLVMLGEGGESKYETNVNFLLEEYGIMFNNGNFPCVTLLSRVYSFILLLISSDLFQILKWETHDHFLPADAVVRTHFYKYFHPKEALIANGVLNRYDVTNSKISMFLY